MFAEPGEDHHGSPETITTDGLHSYGAAMTELGCREKQEVGRWANNRIENSHLPFRRCERAMTRFRRMKTREVRFRPCQRPIPVGCAALRVNLEGHLVDRQTYKVRRAAA